MTWSIESGEPVTVESKRAFVSQEGVRGYRAIRWSEFGQPETYGPVFDVDYNGVFFADGSNTGEEPKIVILDPAPVES